MDASATGKSGLAYGYVSDLGNYEECLSIAVNKAELEALDLMTGAAGGGAGRVSGEESQSGSGRGGGVRSETSAASTACSKWASRCPQRWAVPRPG